MRSGYRLLVGNKYSDSTSATSRTVTVNSLADPSGLQVKTRSPPGMSGLKENMFFLPSNAGLVEKISGFSVCMVLNISKIRRFALISGSISVRSRQRRLEINIDRAAREGPLTH